jgi:pilus assembly protein Flp/PilA
MFKYIKTWASLRSDRRAVTALEYALIAAVLVATVVNGFTSLSDKVSTSFVKIGSHL